MKRVVKLWGLGIATVVLVGCGQAMTGGGAAPAGASFYGMHPMGERGFHAPFGIVRQLGLSSEQRQRLKAIAEAYRPGEPSVDGTSRRDELEDLLLAETVDASALEAFFAQGADAHAKRVPRVVAMLAEMREVLTEPQRERLASALAEPNRARHVRGMRLMAEHFLADLDLTPDQQRTLDAFRAKRETLRQEAGPREAFAAFARSGDQAALTEALSARRELPIAEGVAFLVQLDREQRERLVEKLERFGPHRAPFLPGMGPQGPGFGPDLTL